MKTKKIKGFNLSLAGLLLVSFLIIAGTCTPPPDDSNDPPQNTVPVVNAGPDQSVLVGATVSPNAVAADADDDELSYSWSFAERPSGSAAALTGADMANASFSPDVTGTYRVGVSVSDGEAEAEVELTVAASTDTPPQVVITSPAENTGTGNADYGYDGFDDERGQWYTDVTLTGTANDTEDGVLSGTSLTWTTDRDDIQTAELGTGETLSVRLYSDTCTGV